MFIPEPTAGQIGRDYQKLQKETVKAAVLTPLAVDKLLKQLLAKLKKRKEGLIEIKIDGKLAFKGKTGEKPIVNKLTPQHLKRLNEIINSPTVRSKSSESVEITVDGETVYEARERRELVNKLEPEHSPVSGAVGLRAAIAARQILDSKNTDTYENDTYRIERQAHSLTIKAKDGRGQILNASVENSTMRMHTNGLTAKDVEALQTMIPQQNATVELERD